MFNDVPGVIMIAGMRVFWQFIAFILGSFRNASPRIRRAR